MINKSIKVKIEISNNLSLTTHDSRHVNTVSRKTTKTIIDIYTYYYSTYLITNILCYSNYFYFNITRIVQ